MAGKIRSEEENIFRRGCDFDFGGNRYILSFYIKEETINL